MKPMRWSIRRSTRSLCCVLVTLAAALCSSPWMTRAATKPNIIYIMADDLGYGDLGCYGQKLIQTPNLDRMAAEGMRFTDFYAGSTVCAPSRCVLMTGRHLGHCTVRGNAPGPDMTRQTLRDDDVTVAEIVKQAGYSTALIGKWGLGELGSAGHPLKQGFDYFYGYLNQVHAHNYYPEFLWRNESKHRLRNVVQKAPRAYGNFWGGWATKRVDYSHDLLAREALEWIDAHKNGPFFLYLAFTIPHANNEGTRGTGNGQEVPDYGDYTNKDWTDPNKGQAAMITRLDGDIGRLFDRLKHDGIDEKTIVFFTSDNGPHQEGGNDPEFFDANGPLRGIKRALYDGGVRVPMIVRWPGQIAAGAVSNHMGYFGDILPTVADLAGVEAPTSTDGIGILPTLLGQTQKQKQHQYLYWEFYEQGSRQAVRFGNWKAVVQPMGSDHVELFDLNQDIGEQRDVAAEHPEVVSQAKRFIREAHVPSPFWEIPQRKAKKLKKKT